jgi:hypothetical protein
MTILLSASALGVGCGSMAAMAVTDDALQQRTAFALGLERGSFTISNRQDDGVRTNYVVTTRSGQRYNCYVTGVVNITGRTVSDALCSKPGEAPKNPLLGR